MKFNFAHKVLLICYIIQIYSCKNKLTVEELTADNLNEKLAFSEEGYGSDLPNDYGITNFDPWRTVMYYPELITANPNFENDVYNNPDGVRKRIIKIDRSTGNEFQFILKNKLFESITINNDHGIPEAEAAIEFMLKESGYTYKRTDKISGSDRLIKKVEDSFIVASILRKSEDKDVVFSIMFQVFKQK